MSILTEFTSVAGASIVVGVIAWKFKDVLMDSDVRDLIVNVFRSKDIGEAAKAYIQAINAILGLSFLMHEKIFRILIIYLSSSLVRSIASISIQIIEASPEEKKAKTIVGFMLGEKAERSSRSQLYLGVALAASFVFSIFLDSSINNVAFILISLFFLGIQVDQKLIEYRIKNGWYGNNEFETREIINFIISHANKDDFNDSGGLKKVIPEPELHGAEDTAIVTGGATT
jgi:hypothetical protein